MPEMNEQLEFLATYWGFAIAPAGAFYFAIQWFGKNHLSTELKDTLTRWLRGEYESTWSHHFCNLFDRLAPAEESGGVLR